MLVASARDGELWAREALFRRYAGMLNGLAYRLLGNRQDVDDVVQETFVQALISLPRLKSAETLPSWLGGILVRVVYRLLRRRRLLSRLGFSSGPEIDLESLVGASAPPEVSAELRVIYRHVQSFPAKLRVAFLLRRIEELSLEEVAERMDVSLASVKRHVAAADALLRDRLGTVGGAP